MNDTPLHVEAAFLAMFATRTPSERVRMMSDMFDAARRILVSNIRATHPEITGVELRVQIFLRTYAADFTAEQRDHIVAQIRQSGSSAGRAPSAAHSSTPQTEG